MRIITKHFGFTAHRWFWHRPPRWYCWCIRIGFGDAGEGYPSAGQPYRYWAGVDIQLLPNFIWYQDVIRQDPRVADVQINTRIVGIQDWPFMRFCGGRG